MLAGSINTVAYWIANHVIGSTITGPNATTLTASPNKNIILFLKDNVNVHQPNSRGRTATEMLLVAAQYGFGCFQEPRQGQSIFHQTSVLAQLEKQTYIRATNNTGFKSKYKNLGDWWSSALNLTMPRPFTAVCYGGMFAVSVEQILQMATSSSSNSNSSGGQHIPPGTWQKLTESLERGGTILRRVRDFDQKPCRACRRVYSNCL
jgi:hypothetical protein